MRTKGGRSTLNACGRGSVGRASPCQGEGRGFESRRPLGVGLVPAATGPVLTGGVAERRGNGLQIRVHGFKSRLHLGRLAQLVARFPDTEEVISSSLVPPTTIDSRPHRGGNPTFWASRARLIGRVGCNLRHGGRGHTELDVRRLVPPQIRRNAPRPDQRAPASDAWRRRPLGEILRIRTAWRLSIVRNGPRNLTRRTVRPHGGRRICIW